MYLMTHKRVSPRLLLLAGLASLGSLLSCHCEDCDWPAAPLAPGSFCPAKTSVYRVARGAYRTSEVSVAQDTCNAGVTVDNLQHYQVEVDGSGTYMVLISRVADTSPTLFLGPVHCNVGSSMTATESSRTGACQYERAWSSALTVADENTLEVQVSETWHHVTGTGCPGSEGCLVSYRVTLAR